jgi:hypothetical protein
VKGIHWSVAPHDGKGVAVVVAANAMGMTGRNISVANKIAATGAPMNSIFLRVFIIIGILLISRLIPLRLKAKSL